MYVKTGSSLEHTLGNSYKTHSESESERHSVMSDSLRPRGLYSPWNSLGQNTGMGSLSLLQGIFLTQGLNPGLPHCSQILYQLRHKGSPRILEWVAYPFSRYLPDSGIELGSPALWTELSGKPKTHSEVKLYSEEKYILKPSFTIYYIYSDYMYRNEDFSQLYKLYKIYYVLYPWVGKIAWRRGWHPTPVFLSGESHGQRSLAGYSPCGHKELDTTEWLTHTHSHIYYI